MKKIAYIFFLLLILSLTGCFSGLMTGANIIYDRHHIYKKSTDVTLSAKVGHAIKMEPMLNCPSNKCFEIAVFHGDVLLLGTVTNQEEKDKATEVVQHVGGYRHFYNYILIDPAYDYQDNWNDHWITTQIRSKILANADIDPEPFKIISHGNIVYILGDVMDYQEPLITDICRKVPNVKKVVNLLQTYALQKHKKELPAVINPTPKLQETVTSW